MKHIIIKLSFLFVVMSVLTSSKEDTSIGKINQSINNESACLNTRNDYANNISCKQASATTVKKDVSNIIPAQDNEISLSPISRFILLQ